MKYLALLFPLCAVSACERSESRDTGEATECPELLRFDPATAAVDAESVPAEDAYLLGVYGFTAIVPSRAHDDLPVRLIEGTSDHECPELNARTMEYARRFNEAMQGKLERE